MWKMYEKCEKLVVVGTFHSSFVLLQEEKY
jgi:hypothetical protein